MPYRKPIKGEFSKSNICTAEGLEVKANAPALPMCRKLLQAGFDPERPLHCYRGETLAIKISSIRYGAKYSVSEPSTGSGVRLVPYSEGPRKCGETAPIEFPDAAEDCLQNPPTHPRGPPRLCPKAVPVARLPARRLRLTNMSQLSHSWLLAIVEPILILNSNSIPNSQKAKSFTPLVIFAT
jgi:hypothetical protein